MRLTVVGCSPAWPNPGEAHSGYLLEGTGRLLIDCGPGVLAKLREHENGWPRVDAIVISHWHLDHWGDLVPWVWGRMFGLGRELASPVLWGPPGTAERLTEFGEWFGTPEMFTRVFEIREFTEREPFEAAGLTLTAVAVPHYTIPTYAFRITDGTTMFVYSGDSAPSEALIDAARDADVFLCEATLASSDKDNPAIRGHLSADEAVATFRASGAKRLLLTHRPRELGLDNGLELVQEGLVLDL
jgi:ribonuclease BN (tRNA processing enzyme)